MKIKPDDCAFGDAWTSGIVEFDNETMWLIDRSRQALTGHFLRSNPGTVSLKNRYGVFRHIRRKK